MTPDDFAQQKPAQDATACPTCNDAPGAAPFCSNGYHVAPIPPPYTTPVPTFHDGSTGWVYCEACDAPQPVAGHECGPAVLVVDGSCSPEELASLKGEVGVILPYREPLSFLVEAAKQQDRAEFAESLLCALAWDHASAIGAHRYGLDSGCALCAVDSAARGGGR